MKTVVYNDIQENYSEKVEAFDLLLNFVSSVNCRIRSDTLLGIYLNLFLIKTESVESR